MLLKHLFWLFRAPQNGKRVIPIGFWEMSKFFGSIDVEELIKSGEKIVISHQAERTLALQIQSFADVIDLTLDDLLPYHICDYVYELSIAGSTFVTQCRVLGSPEMKSRLLLCHVTAMAMHQCFDLLGIRHVKRI